MQTPAIITFHAPMSVSMNKPLTHRDASLLQSSGFQAASLWSWFGIDRHEQIWQVQEAEDNSLLQFRLVGHKSTGEWVHMNRQQFDNLFARSHPASTN